MAPRRISPAGVCLVQHAESRVLAGPFSAGRLDGVDRLTLRHDGSAFLESRAVLQRGDAQATVDVAAAVVPAPGTSLPSLAALAGGCDLPDEDLRLGGTMLIRTADPRFSHVDGTLTRVEGWVNLESGELELEARTAAAALA